jgi:hypothetical protein
MEEHSPTKIDGKVPDETKDRLIAIFPFGPGKKATGQDMKLKIYQLHQSEVFYRFVEMPASIEAADIMPFEDPREVADCIVSSLNDILPQFQWFYDRRDH